MLYSLGDWIYSLAVVILAYHLGGGLAAAAAILLAQAGGRLLSVALAPMADEISRLRTLTPGIEVARAGLIASLMFVTARDQLWAAMLVAATIGLVNPFIESARPAGAATRRPRTASPALRARLACRWDQVAMIAGSASCGLIVVTWSERPAFALAALASLAATLLAGAAASPRPAQARQRRGIAAADSPPDRALRTVYLLLLALAGAAALGISIRILLVEIVLDDHAGTELVYGLFIALAGTGAFAGPLSTPRLLGKLPAELILAGIIAALVTALVATHLVDPLALAIPIIVGCGVLSITGERAGETVVRRLVPDRELDSALRLLVLSTIAGQVTALSIVAGLDYLSSVAVILAALSAVSIVCAAVPLLMYIRRDSSALVAGGD